MDAKFVKVLVKNVTDSDKTDNYYYHWDYNKYYKQNSNIKTLGTFENKKKVANYAYGFDNQLTYSYHFSDYKGHLDSNAEDSKLFDNNILYTLKKDCTLTSDDKAKMKAAVTQKGGKRSSRRKSKKSKKSKKPKKKSLKRRRRTPKK